MSLWPFRRRASRKRRGRQAAEYDGPARATTESAVATMTPAAKDGMTRRMSKKLRRRARAYSFSPGRRDSIRLAPPVPPMPAGPIPVPVSKGTDVERVPTLHHNNSRNKRRGQPLPRKKSSKRRKEDHDREVEVKAMSHLHPTPLRPATDNWTMGRTMKRDTKSFRAGLTRDWTRPESDISLPNPESIKSAMSTESEQISWKVSTLEALAPRPTLRYSSNPMLMQSDGSWTAVSPTQKRKLSERGPLSPTTLKAHKRIDDLADDLDAAGLRELMERDKRRRERKRDQERERVERRLTRKAEKQRQEHDEAERNGTPPPQNLERGVLGRESQGLGIETTSAVLTSSRSRSSEDSPRKREKQPAQLNAEEPQARERTPSPLDKFHRVDSIPLESVPAVKAARPETPRRASNELARQESRSSSPKIMGFIRSKKNRSKSPTQTDEEKTESLEKAATPESKRIASKSEESESGGRHSDSGSSRGFMSLFKWGRSGKNRHGSGPSSFSNTSRDSMLNQQQQPTPPVNYVPARSVSSKLPKRTMSRFREDLPELPLSPPDSRVASPEADALPEPLPVITDDVAARFDGPISQRDTPISMHREREEQTSPPPQSITMSMASIDSEGSWLSGGKAYKRASSNLRASLTGYPLRSVSGESEDPDADDGIRDDDFMKTVTDRNLRTKSTGEARPSSDFEEDQSSPKWGTVNQIPTVMHQSQTMKSYEGLLSSYDDVDNEKESNADRDSEKDSEDGQSDNEAPLPQRATSINLGKSNGRNFSAGSAKLLDVSPRMSGERRRSTEPATQ